MARALLRRERRALEALARDGARLDGVPRVARDEAAERLASPDGRAPRAKEVLLRTWIEGRPLHLAEELPEDFFDHLEALAQALHARGVCHNDLHKEQNVLVGADGFPHLIDFQLASVHVRRGRVFASRARDDLRHLQKHRRRYTRDGRGPAAADERHGAGRGLRRSFLARTWRRWGKPLYELVTRRLLRTRDGEERRPSSGPWPRWTPARGPRHGRSAPRSAPGAGPRRG